ncbi:MAG TPA: tRNA pseudouridine(13) synthase TruD [Gemmataceae bacterium]|nr:tRNA pseudouridine(13) synthase TruD [Gemmataceae bacterium]
MNAKVVRSSAFILDLAAATVQGLHSMHIKEKSEDFRVEELTSVQPTAGDFAFYRLEKRGWTTPDALAIIRRRWKLQTRRLSIGGLKDRHAETVQYLTIYRGPQRKLTHPNLQLTYLGQVPEAYQSSNIEGNRFAITVRSMTEEQLTTALRGLEEVVDAGVPNYYDDQRFGSVNVEGAFFAYQLLIGEFEAALHMALTAPYAFERAAQKREKSILRQNWGDWKACRQRLPGNRIVEHLVAHPEDFRGALERLPPELRTLYLSAYQSHLWNRMLADWLRDHVPAQDLTMVRLRLGELPMAKHLSPDLLEEVRALELPLHSARTRLEDDDPRKPYFDRVLAEEEVTLEQFKLKGFRDLFFSKGERAAWCFPQNLEARSGNDEQHARKKKLTLRFDLQRGSYATLVVKRITRVEEVD